MDKKDFKRGVPGEISLSADPDIANWQRMQHGMFIHWGLYSVFGGEVNGEAVRDGYSEQIQMWAAIPEDAYLRAADAFTGEGFDPDAICRLALDAGMRYIVITSKHHDGFAMFDTAMTDYNVVKQTPFGKDPLKMLAEACERHGLGFGVYFSLVDWHLGHEYDLNNNNPIPPSMESVIEAQLTELMTNYGRIVEVWFDMSSPTPEQSARFAGIVKKHQPHAAVNSRIWNNTGDFRTLGDNQIPATTLDGPWQTPASIYHETWGYRKWQARTDFDGKVRDLVEGLTSVRARGGNYLLNIGPTGDGGIVPFERDVLQGIGHWLNQYPNAVVGASATRFGGQSWGEVTANGRDLYLHIYTVPEEGRIILQGLDSAVADVTDADGTALDWQLDGARLEVEAGESAVIKVTLLEDLYVIPQDVIRVASGKAVHAEEKHIHTGFGFADQGNYHTLTETQTRKTVFFENDQDGEVLVTLSGEEHDLNKVYSVSVDGDVQIISAAAVLNRPIGPFAVKAGQIHELTVTVAEPAFAEEALALDVRGMTLEMV